MRGHNGRHNNNYSHIRPRKAERFILDSGNKPEPPSRDHLREIHAERQRRLQEAALRRMSDGESSHEIESEYNLGNPDLPAYKHKNEIQETVRDNQVTIIVGETGSGKSTQIPQFLMEAGYDNITMTQPRILAANGVAERIEAELADFGNVDKVKANELVGIHTSELNTVNEDTTSIRVVTDGLKLAQSFGNRDHNSEEVLIIDEVHEWNTNIEILVARAKQMIAERPNMRLVVMSATMNAEKLSNYFADAVGGIPPIVEIEGRTFGVERLEKPNSTVLNETLHSLDEEGDILVFVPGKAEIKDTIDELNRRLSGTPYSDALILPLHSKMSKQEQDLVYLQPEGKKKIVVATGIAQTSITIPGITTVVDAGLERRIEFDDDNELGLELHPTARDTCLQRAGRAGRVQPGRYILTRMNDKSKFIPFISREQESKPEILRTDLAKNVLQAAAADMDFAELDLFHPVEVQRITYAKDTLHILGALDIVGDNDDAVTNTGYYMNKFPLRVSLSRMMAEARDKSENVRKFMAAITSSVEAGNLQSFVDGTEKNWKLLTDGESDSDLVAQLRIFSKVFNEGFTSEHENDLSFNEYVDDYDLDAKNVHRALHQYRKNSRHAEVPSEIAFKEFEPPTQGELDEIYSCIYSGMSDMVYRKSGRVGYNSVYQRLGSINKTQREVSNRSVVDSPGDWLVGFAYHHEAYRNGEKETRNIVEGVTKVVNPIDLAKSGILGHRIKREPRGYQMRDGRLMESRELKLYGESMGIIEESTPEFNKDVERAMLREVLAQANRLPTVKRLFEVKKSSEDLAKKDPLHELNPITQDEINGIILSVIRSGRYTTVWDVENELMVFDNIEDKFNLLSMRDESIVERIMLSSPDEVEFEGLNLKLYYTDGIPVSKNIPEGLNHAIYLEDGREIMFEQREKSKSRGGRKRIGLISGSRLNTL